MEPMFDHHRGDRRDLDHLMTQRIWILTLQQGAAAAAGVKMVFQHLVNALDGQLLRPCSGMARLPTPLAATAFAERGRLKPQAVTGGRFGGVARGAANPLAQLSKFSGQSDKALAKLSVLFPEGLHLAGNLSDTRWSDCPVRA